MNHNKRGEIATVVALAALVVIGISSFIASNLLKQKFTFLPRAQTSTTWSLDSWDEAANRCPDKGSGLGPCICSQLQSEGICAPVSSINAKGLTCIRNKWDTTWGCWGNPGSVNVPGTPDSSSVPSGDSCGTIQSQYGTCPDWASENSCHQRLDPPGDPDYGLWFKCVNRWWNGPCASKEACEGSVAAPPADSSSTAVDTSTNGDATSYGGLAVRNGNCFSYDNCKDNCVLNAQNRGESDADQWYCNATKDGKGDVTGRYCCYPELSDRVSLTPTPGPGRLGGKCVNVYSVTNWCYPGLKCENSKCVESTSSPTPRPTRTPTPSTTPGPSPTPTPAPVVIAGNEEGTCTSIPTDIKFGPYLGTYSVFKETFIGSAPPCGNNVLVGQFGEDRVYRSCPTNSSPICLYTCYRGNQVYNCQNVNDQNSQEIVRILNDTSASIHLDNLEMKKYRWGFNVSNIINLNGGDPINGGELKSGETRTVDFSNDPQVKCSGFSGVDAMLYYRDNSGNNTSTPRTPVQNCITGIELLIIIK